MRSLPVLLACLILAGCGPERAAPSDAGELRFLRGALLAPQGAGGRVVGGDRELVVRPWSPGEVVALPGARSTAPARPECLPLFSVELGDVSRLIALGGEAPPTALAWAPDGERLAVGSYRGEVLVLDGWTGAVLARRGLAETLVKAVAWSADGGTLYAAEQSPDALVHALDPRDLRSRWTFRPADELGSSPAPAGDSVYGVYTLPAAHELHVLADGDLLVPGNHSWVDAEGSRRNASRLYRLGPDGAVRDAWPEAGPADASFFHLRLDEDADLLITPVNRSAVGPAPEDLPIGGLQVLRISTLEPVASLFTEPLRPHYDYAMVWEAFDIDGGAARVLAGYGDGRVRLLPLGEGEPVDLAPGTPVQAGEVPIAASVGWGFLRGELVVANTSDTNVPYGAGSTAMRPPSAHPAENTIWAWDTDGRLRWTWQPEHAIQGLWPSPDGSRLVVGGGPRRTDRRRDLFGALVLRLDGDGGGDERLEAVCSTDSPVFFRQAVRDDGRIAVAEHPFRGDDGAVHGAYRVTVLR